jgi:osmotically-inducible protein OsmY
LDEAEDCPTIAAEFVAWIGGREVLNLRGIGVAATLCLPVALGGCPLAIVGGLGAAGGAGYAANNERGSQGSIDDFAVKSNIQKAWLQANPLLQTLNINVYEGRVLLTGMVPTPEAKAQATQIATQVPGVRAVYNEIEVALPETAWADAQDTWISSRLRTDLAFTPEIRSTNYTIETVNGSVFLIGSARSQYELDRVTAIARNIPDVKRVVSYVEVRPGMPVAAQQPLPTPTPPPPPGETPTNLQGAATPMAAPTTAVEAEKL